MTSSLWKGTEYFCGPQANPTPLPLPPFPVRSFPTLEPHKDRVSGGSSRCVSVQAGPHPSPKPPRSSPSNDSSSASGLGAGRSPQPPVLARQPWMLGHVDGAGTADYEARILVPYSISVRPALALTGSRRLLKKLEFVAGVSSGRAAGNRHGRPSRSCNFLTDPYDRG